MLTPTRILIGALTLGLLSPFALLSAQDAPAGPTIVAYYRMGEDDTDANVGQVVSTTADNLMEGTPLSASGQPKYVDVTGSPFARSSKAIRFDGPMQVLRRSGMEPSNHFVIEAFVRASSNEGFGFIASWGAGTHGYNLVRNNQGYQVLLGGINLVGWSGDQTAGNWVHVALVRDGDVTRFFFNGNPSGENNQKPNAVDANTPFGIGAPGAGDEGYFAGEIDEVRIWTFEPGTFNANQLLINQR